MYIYVCVCVCVCVVISFKNTRLSIFDKRLILLNVEGQTFDLMLKWV